MWTVFFISLIVLMVTAVASFELLIYTLCAHHPAAWAKAGKPIGFGHSPTRVGMYGWVIARYKLQKEFLFQVPSWTKHDSFGYLLLLIYKAAVFLYLGGVLGFLIAALLLS